MPPKGSGRARGGVPTPVPRIVNTTPNVVMGPLTRSQHLAGNARITGWINPPSDQIQGRQNESPRQNSRGRGQGGRRSAIRRGGASRSHESIDPELDGLEEERRRMIEALRGVEERIGEHRRFDALDNDQEVNSRLNLNVDDNPRNLNEGGNEFGDENDRNVVENAQELQNEARRAESGVRNRNVENENRLPVMDEVTARVLADAQQKVIEYVDYTGRRCIALYRPNEVPRYYPQEVHQDVLGRKNLPDQSVIGGMDRHVSAMFQQQSELIKQQTEALEEMRKQLEMTKKGSKAIGAMVGNKSPLSEDILNEPLPVNFILPILKNFAGATDPFEHIDQFNDRMGMVTNSDNFKCKCFPATLEGGPRVWFHSLPAGSIQTWKRCQELFLTQYSALRKHLKPSSHLGYIRQERGESLRKYIARFQSEAARSDKTLDDVLLSYVSNGLDKSGRLSEKLYDKPAVSLADFYACADHQIQWEENKGKNVERKEEVRAPASLVPGYDAGQRAGYGQSLSGRGSGQIFHNSQYGRGYARGSSGNTWARGRAGQQGNGPSGYKRSKVEDIVPPMRNEVFTLLSVPPGRIFSTERGNLNFGTPRRDNSRGDQTKFCRYHNQKGHETNDCFQLKKAIEDLIQKGYLKAYVKDDIRNPPGSDAPSGLVEIRTVHGGRVPDVLMEG